MNTDRILPVNREHLLLMQVLCWLGPGIKVLTTGIQAMLYVNTTHPERVWWLMLIAIMVTITFSLMFNNFIKRYTARILNFPERKKSLFAFFDAHGYETSVSLASHTLDSVRAGVHRLCRYTWSRP